MGRIWKQISLTPYYEVSNDGKVRNKETGKILKGRLKTTSGYIFKEVV